MTKYDIDDRTGIITSPGGFEGEMLYVPHFWDVYLDGGADRDDGKVLGFDIAPEDRAIYAPYLDGRRTVKLYEDDQGFVREV